MLIYIKSYHVNILIKKINEENKNVKKKKEKKIPCMELLKP